MSASPHVRVSHGIVIRAGSARSRGLGRLGDRTWLMAPTVAAVLTMSLLAVPPQPAQAHPDSRPAPAGARATAPSQQEGSAAGRAHLVSAREAAAGRAAGSRLQPPEVPGAVGPEIRYPDVTLPEATVPEQAVDLSVVEPAAVEGYVDGESVELVSERGPSTAVFRNPDGSRTLRLYEGVAFTPDPGMLALAEAGLAFEAGELLQPVDTTLVGRPDGRIAPVRAEAVSFGPHASDEALAWVDVDEQVRIGFGLVGAADAEPSLDGSTVTYREVARDADVTFTVTSAGFKEEIVLHSPQAPRSWLFRFELDGVTPSLDEDGGFVTFTDAAGEVRGYVPPGYMIDSNIHPRRGDGESSVGVHYSLYEEDGHWMLRVDLDEQWLNDPARVYPVYVDPTYQRNADSDDTFVSSRNHANMDNSWRTELKVGTYDGGGEKTASYLHFDGLLSAKPNRWVHGAAFNVYNHWSYSCTARPVSVYKVTKSWSGSTTKTWSGPSYDSSNRLARESFAYGYYDCPQGGWGTFPLPADRVMKWLHGTESFHGITLRASSSDSLGWKRFWSANYGTSSARPYIDLNYADQGAKYSLPTGTFDPPVTGSSSGEITVRVTNWGMTTWTPTNGYRLRLRVYDSSGSLVQSVPFISMPKNVAPHKSVDIPVTVAPLPPANYTMRIYMVTPDTVSFQNAHGVPYAQAAFTVANGPPTIVGNYPPHNGYVSSLTPTLWADYYDPDDYPSSREFRFRLCEGAPGGGGDCANSGWITSATWHVPEGYTSWHTPSYWEVRVSDTENSSPYIGPFVFTPVVPQPPITSHLAGAPDGADVPGLNPLVGNYTSTVTDASVNVVGPSLEITRTYNSQDPRHDGAFGAGWSTPIDQRLVEEDDGSVLITLASGRQLRFGRNLDGSYSPPSGINLTLVPGESTWTLRGASGAVRTFDAQGRLAVVADADGREQTYIYSGGQVTQVQDAASGRALHLTWTGGHVTSVATDPPDAGQPAPTWTYDYDGDLLIEACTPLSAASCTTYEYQESSHYRATILDHNPTAYWPLGDTGTDVARNVVSRTGSQLDGHYSNVTQGVAGGLAGSTDTAAEFSGTLPSSIALPPNLLNSSMAFSIELWYRVDSGNGGVLIGQQDTTLDKEPTTDRSFAHLGGGQLCRKSIVGVPTSSTCLSSIGGADGQWHHLVITVMLHEVTFYVDNLQVFELPPWVYPTVIDHYGMSYLFLGTGAGGGTNWPSGEVYHPLTGQLDDVAFYNYPLSASQVFEHWNARNSTQRLVKIVEPGEFAATQIAYDGVTGRVSTLLDRHGEQWTLEEPAVEGSEQAVVLNSAGAGSVTYRYDLEHGGRLVSREDEFGEQTWEYNAAGFVSKVIDANGNAVALATDERGNVVGRTTCRAAEDCATEYFGYFHNPADPLDPRNDVRVWQADGRSASAEDTTYRTSYDIDSAGRVVGVTYPTPAGHSSGAVEALTYSPGQTQEYAVYEEPRAFVSASTDLALSGDDEIAQINLPFPVDYYGRTYGQAWVSTNGFLSFKETSCSCYWAKPIPDSAQPNAALYPLWEDWVVDSAASIHTEIIGAAPDRTFVVEWRNARLYSDENVRASFQVLISETGEITFNYLDTDGLAEASFEPVVGVEDATGVAAVSHQFVTGVPTDGVAVVLTEPPPVTPAGLLTESVAANGGIATYEYDLAGDLLRVEDPVGLVEEYTYDDLGRVASVTSSSATGAYGTTTYTYNNLSLVETVTSPAVTNPVTQVTHTPVATYTYDDAGRVTSLTVSDATGGDNDRVWSWAYDPAGRRVSSTTPDGAVTGQEWDARGDLVRVTEPGGLVLEHTYDAAHRLVETAAVGAGVDPLDELATRLVLESRAYDPGGRLAAVVDAMGRETAYTYYGDDRLATVSRVRRDGEGEVVDILLLAEHEYDDAGRVTTSTDAGGVDTTYSYDPAGYLISETLDPAGLARAWTVERNLDGSPSAVEVTGADSPGRVERTSYTYDAARRLLSETVHDPGAATPELTTTLERDPRGLVVEQTDPSGVSAWFDYDELGRLVSETGAARDVWTAGVLTADVQPVTTYGHNTFGERTHVVDPAGATTRTVRDGMGRPVEMHLPAYTPPGGQPILAVEQVEYDQRGLPVKVTDPLGRVTEHTYDQYGRPNSRTLPDPDGAGPLSSPVWAYAYDRAGQLLETTDPTGGQLLATYDDLGRQITSTVSDRTTGSTLYLTIEYGYDEAGDLTSITSPTTATTTTTYNTAGEPLRVTDPSGRFNEFTYDLAGRVVATVNGRYTSYADPITTFTYDLAGRLVAEAWCTADAAGGCDTVLQTITLDHDPAGRPTLKTTADGRISTYGYDPAGQLISITQLRESANPSSGITVELGYDRVGRRSRIADGNGNPTVYTYNPWGLTQSVVEPVTTAHPMAADRTWTTVYDAAGQAVRHLLPGGVTRDVSYDNLGNLVGETGAGAEAATVARSIGYDPLGRITSISGPGGDTTYTWDDRGLLTGSGGLAGTASFAYNGDGLMVSRTDAAGTSTFTYNLMGALATATDPFTGHTATFSYTDAGLPAAVAWSSGATSGAGRTYDYDQLGRLISDTWHDPTNTTVASTSYTYDHDNLVTSKITTGIAAGAHGYAYDGLGRLAEWTRPDSQVVTYGYDDASNRTILTDPGGQRTATYDQRNRLLDITGGGQPSIAHTWTPRGTLATSTAGTETTTYAFDAFERLIQASGPGYNSSYGYDALDRLAAAGTDIHLYADLTNNPVRVPAASGDTLLARAPDGAPLVAQSSTNSAQVLLADPIHFDVIAAADPATAALSASAVYQPFGEIAAATGDLPLGYQGGWTDPDTGHVNAHARWYQPDTGTFTSRDTWTLPPHPVAQTNRYMYGNGEPVRNADPSGHCPWCAIIIDVGLWIVKDIVKPNNAGEACTGPFGLKPDAGHPYCGLTNAQACAMYWDYFGNQCGSGALGAAPASGSAGIGAAPTGSNDSNGPSVPPVILPVPVPVPVVPPIVVPPVAPRPGPAPTQRPTRYDPTDGRGVSNPSPRTSPSPRITVDGGGTLPHSPPHGTRGGPLPVPTNPGGPLPTKPEDLLLGLAVSFLRGAASAGLLTRIVDLASVSNPRMTPDETDRSDRCHAGDWPWPDNPYYHPLEGGRATLAEACYVGGARPVYGTPATYTPPGFPADMERGHLIAGVLSGDGGHPGNIVPLYRRANQRMSSKIEMKVVDRIVSGETIYYRVQPLYRNDESTPYALRIVIAGDRVPPTVRILENEP